LGGVILRLILHSLSAPSGSTELQSPQHWQLLKHTFYLLPSLPSSIFPSLLLVLPKVTSQINYCSQICTCSWYKLIKSIPTHLISVIWLLPKKKLLWAFYSFCHGCLVFIRILQLY
jgi:hypothetical protein